MKFITTPALLLSTLLLASACGMRAPLRPHMKPLPLAQAHNKPLTQNHFKGDKTHRISELDLQRVLNAPTFLEEKARVGVLSVSSGYEVDRDLPLVGVPGELSHAMERAGLFEGTTEVTTDWPMGSGVPGLRELAARYRCEYLLLYRHRFVDREWTNGWGALAWTVVAALAAPMKTLEAAGVLEATLFDVRTGTLLFTVYERVHARADENVWGNDRKRRELKERMLTEAAEKLATASLRKLNQLVAARPEPEPAPGVTPPTVGLSDGDAVSQRRALETAP